MSFLWSSTRGYRLQISSLSSSSSLVLDKILIPEDEYEKYQIRSVENALIGNYKVSSMIKLDARGQRRRWHLTPDTWNLQFLTTCCQKNPTKGLCSEVQGSAQPPGQKNRRSNRKRNFEKANVEYRIMNIECRSNVFCLSWAFVSNGLFLKKDWAKRNHPSTFDTYSPPEEDSIFCDSAVRFLTLCSFI